MDDTTPNLTEMTTDIVAAYLSQNRVDPAEVGSLILSVHAALAGLGQPAVEPETVVDKPTAAQVRKSITEGGLISFLDGRTYQSLKRHLTTRGMTPQGYREQFGLPAAYPMVAPAYAARRSALAKAMGLGQGGRKPTGKAGRPKKAS
jgi:predicted transcriptional regulator